MPSKKDLFEVSGPTHLTSIDWNCPNYQRSVAASLVQGVYVLERDRQKRRCGSEARAPSWYQHFNFKLSEILVDNKDKSIFGAIYEYNPPGPLSDFALHHGSANAPGFILAFRGTLLRKNSFIRDLKLDLGIVKNGLENTNRVQNGYQAVHNLVKTHGHQNIWVAGHSLGAAIAILVGKSMAKLNVFVKSFLFNPPYVAAPIERIKSAKIKNGIRLFHGFVKAGVVSVLRHGESSNDCFEMLASWVPQLYVNPADNICCEYIGYYERRKMMEDIGANNLEIIVAKNSVRDLVLNFSGNESEPLHSIPSAVLNVNQNHSSNIFSALMAHRIRQWWQPDLTLDSRDYRTVN
ncbi:hypothetical protein LUZ61_013988 [Rhynchospora tenuis]|uniref:Fungal lipase-type domain-containing protein n=1 Tax=Rhynchospora tenuis TaxID=198213 RepID=A0AAD5WAM3_9POAL|nr:hypothetical protein LUZ61_013988 [Rhynchospora tenuis]